MDSYNDELELLATIGTLEQQVRQLKAEKTRWERIARQAFDMHGGCLPLCRRACMCTCGYELYFALTRNESENG